MIYPRGEGETAPQATALAPGVTKVVTSESTDYVFLSTTPLTYSGEGVDFTGLSGAVRVGHDGKATLVLSSGPGKVGYKSSTVSSDVPFEKVVSAGGKEAATVPAPTWSIQAPDMQLVGQPVSPGVTKVAANGVTHYSVDAPATITAVDGEVQLEARRATVVIDHDKIRFVVPEHAYARLSVGAVGVRGVGPFDLTFTHDAITGKVDGDVRTLVTTWPLDLTRPMYRMDGVRWYAGFADEHSIVKGTKPPNSASPWVFPRARTMSKSPSGSGRSCPRRPHGKP